jgi:hypothetical protein
LPGVVAAEAKTPALGADLAVIERLQDSVLLVLLILLLLGLAVVKQLTEQTQYSIA